MLNRFLSPRLERLSADGGLTTVAEGSTPLLPPVALIDRRLCVFERFASPATGRAARQAARVYGRSNAPFDRSGFVMIPCPGGFGLWWWDADQVDGLLGARFSRGLPATVPETLSQPAGSGWRQVRLESGYEAQRWDAGRLVASAWRPAAFDDAAWSNFTRTAVDPGEDAPEHAPAAQSLPAVATPELLAIGARSAGPDSWVRPAVAFAIALSLGMGAFFAGQAWRLDTLTDRAEAETAVLSASQDAGQVARLRSQLARLDSFSSLLDRPDPSASLAIAIGVLQLYGVPPQSFSADATRVRLELPYSALSIAPELAGQFAASGGFTDVQVSTGANRSAVIFEMTPPPPDAPVSIPSGPASSLVAAAETTPLTGSSGSVGQSASDSSSLSIFEQQRMMREMAQTDGQRARATAGTAASPAQAQPRPTAQRPAAQPARPRPAPAQPTVEDGDDDTATVTRQPGGDIPASVLEAARKAGYRGN
ncbi:hypothetical protein [Brevundimonas lutea]|uniref:hypothetical protein n=1 Tax=Brevundimonas lutea TaxID=2293980 RepID=UPI000F04061D|nr:hypothetical protein [Brevundimonas lutea]